MQFNRKFLMISIIVIVVGLAGWRTALKAGWFESAEGEQSKEQASKEKMNNAFKSLDDDDDKKGKAAAITVEAEPVRRGDLIQTVSAQGRVHAYQTVDLTLEISGRLSKLNVKDGNQVKKGQVIAKIDSREYELQVKQAEAALLKAKADFVDFDQDMRLEESDYQPGNAQVALEKQFKDGLISKEKYQREKLRIELDEVRSGKRREEVVSARFLAQAEVDLAKARLNLEKCTLKAPFSGTVFGVEVSEGSLLSGSTKVARLVNMDDLVVKAQVLEAEIGQVQENRPARVSFTALPDLEELSGTVQAVSPFVDDEQKTVEAILSVKNKDKRIRPGMFAEAKIDARIYKDRLMVPKQAILPRDNRKVVFKVSAENQAKWVYVTTGVENDEYVEIVEGELNPGDMVLTDNHFTMGHDTLVKIAQKK